MPSSFGPRGSVLKRAGRKLLQGELPRFTSHDKQLAHRRTRLCGFTVPPTVTSGTPRLNVGAPCFQQSGLSSHGPTKVVTGASLHLSTDKYYTIMESVTFSRGKGVKQSYANFLWSHFQLAGSHLACRR